MAFLYKFARKAVTFLIGLFLFAQIFVPLLLIYCPYVVELIVFSHFVSLPFSQNLPNLAHYGLDPTRSTFHQVRTPDGVLLGAWLIRPPANVKHRRQVVLYHHGNGGHRGVGHQVSLYKVLAEAGFDVVAFDYRGFGDTVCTFGNCDPSELGFSLDSHAMYEWVLADIAKRWKGSKESIIIWGHSLGGGAATNLARSLCPDAISNCSAIKALVLESTFCDLIDAALQYPLMWPFWWNGPVLSAVSDAIIERHVRFNNSDSLGKLRLPVLMLHAEDDITVPAESSKRAFLASTAERPSEWPQIKYKLFSGQYGYGHHWLYSAPDLIPILIDFLTNNALKPKA